MKKTVWIITLLFLLCTMTSCGYKAQETVGYQIYYTNTDRTKLVTQRYSPKGTKAQDILAELLEQMKDSSQPEERKSLLTDGVEITDYSLTDGQLTLTFSESYQDMDNISEVLLRSGIVLMTTQIPEVRTVVFHIGDDVLRDSTGEPVGAMTSNMFINNAVGINSYQYASLSLYFPDKSGEKLVREMRNVHYSSNTTLEKVVMEQLFKGPMNKELQPIVSEEVKTLSISIDGTTCILNLNEAFLTDSVAESVEPEITILAIVNTLCDALGVDHVQFAIDGDSNVMYRDELSFAGPFHRNSDKIAPSNAEDEAMSEIAEPSIGL